MNFRTLGTYLNIEFVKQRGRERCGASVNALKDQPAPGSSRFGRISVNHQIIVVNFSDAEICRAVALIKINLPFAAGLARKRDIHAGAFFARKDGQLRFVAVQDHGQRRCGDEVVLLPDGRPCAVLQALELQRMQAAVFQKRKAL